MYTKLYSNDTTVNPLGRPITATEDSWLSSLMNFGAICGAIPIGLIADKIGRRYTLLGLAVPHVVAFSLYAFAGDINIFYVGRFINGFSEGAGYAILPMYLTEISEDSNRASISVTLNLFWCIGNFIPYAFGPYMTSKAFNILLACIPLTFFVCFLLIGPETPHYLIQRKKYEKAEKVIQYLRGCSDEAAQKEVDSLKVIIHNEEHQGGMLDILRNACLRKALIISLILITLQQMSGINAINAYMEPIFTASGSNLPSSTSSTIVGACMVLSSLFTTLIIQKTGRKWPMLISCMGDGLSLVALGTYFYLNNKTTINTDNLTWLPITALISYMLFFNLGFSPLPWTISSELFPNNVKAVSSSAVSACSWVFGFLTNKFFNLLNDTIGQSGSFWLFGGSCFVAAIFDIVFVPETTGKSFSEIQELLK